MRSISIALLACFILACQENSHDQYPKSLSKSEQPQKELLRMNGPERFMAYHQAIRTRHGSLMPDYHVGYRTHALKKAIKRKPSVARRSAPLPWIERGPGNVAGRARGLWLDPSDTSAQTLLVGSVGGGIWKTQDAGLTWRNVTPDFPTLSTRYDCWWRQQSCGHVCRNR